MNGLTGGNRGTRRTGALAVVAATALPATACNVVHVQVGSSGGPATTGSANYRADLAYAQCMRAHGMTKFPNPNPSGFSFSMQREVLIPSSYTVADVALSIRQDTRRRDRGTGQLGAGS